MNMESSSFHRSPSKVWWSECLEEGTQSSWNSRTGTGSPSSHKSQDSGFSDSEISPTLGVTEKPKCRKEKHENNLVVQNAGTPKRLFVTDKIQTNILKDMTSIDNSTPKKNFTENIKEKYSPKKSITRQITDECLKKTKSQRIYERHDPCCRSLPSTPKSNVRHLGCMSKSSSQAPSPLQSPLLRQSRKLTLFNSDVHEINNRGNDTVDNTQNSYFLETLNEHRSEINKQNNHVSPKVSRNLLNYFPQNVNDNVIKELSTTSDAEHNRSDNVSMGDRNFKLHSITLPVVSQPSMKSKLNATIPLYYQYNLDKIESDFENTSFDSSKDSNSDVSINDISNEAVTSESFSFKNEESSDCEKEVELFFHDQLDKLEPPTHTSTPKNNFKKTSVTPLRKKIVKQKKNSHMFETLHKVPAINPHLIPQIPPVKCWLNEVEQLYEPECMTTLQSKSIANDLARHVSRQADSVTAPIREMLQHSKIIVKEFNKIQTQIQRSMIEHIRPLTQSLVGNITEFVLKNMVNSQSCSLVDLQQTKNGIHNLLEVSGQLRQSTMASCLDIQEIYELILNLQEMFFTTEHNILAMQIQLLVNALEEPSSHLALRGILSGITSLALQCERLGTLVVQAGGPRAFLIICVESKASTIRTMALRSLATVCCSTTAIRQLEHAGGVEVLADILSDNSRPEPELSEATAVLAQITAPWIEDNHNVQGLVENIDPLITAITDFMEKTKCCQNLLLCAAALANITYMNVNGIDSLKKNETIGKLLTAVRNRGPRASVFLKEQTATLIANLSDIPEARNYLAKNNTGVALLCFLQIYPITSQEENQCNASQRLQQKSAIALSRLCSDTDVAKQIVALGGVTRLVQLCKEGKERNNSDAVLVASLATLRKIVANCGTDVMDQQDIMELVEPRLLDSFLAYSSQNESYV